MPGSDGSGNHSDVDDDVAREAGAVRGDLQRHVAEDALVLLDLAKVMRVECVPPMIVFPVELPTELGGWGDGWDGALREESAVSTCLVCHPHTCVVACDVGIGHTIGLPRETQDDTCCQRVCGLQNRDLSCISTHS